MSRHRDVRCMNYSDEYDGYDDVYGHSVEDDYCVSPSAEQFLFDRSKQQNIASFITEPDIVEDNEDIEDSVSSHNDKKLDFSEIETAKLISCIESIRNVIGDLVPESKLKEEIIKADFDTEAVLDAILKKSSPTSISKQSVDNKDYLDCCPDGSTDMINNTNCPIPSFPLQRKFRFITDNTTTETVTNTPGTCLSNSFSSLTEMIAHHTKSVSSSVKKPIENDKKIQSFGSLADLTAHHLQNANGNTLSKAALHVTTPTTIKVIPAGRHSVVKGFNVSGVENVGHLSPQMGSPRSGSPSSERCSPDIKHKEEIQKERKILSSKTNSPRCQSPATGRVTPDVDSKMKTTEEKIDVLAIYKSKRGATKDQLHLVVVGHVDAGKSTLLGRLLCDLGQVSSRLIHKYQQESKKIGKQSFAYAWVLDETGEERQRGITMDIGHSKFETDTKCITLLDAPGHKDFIPNMISGATQADVALLVVDAVRGEFETGFDSGGQTREHALLLRSLGVSQIAVVVNKLDMVDWSEERFNEIVDKMKIFLKQAGFKDTVLFVPCSGLLGENIATKPKAEDFSKWYDGPTLINVIDSFKCPERPVNKPFRFSVNDVYKSTGFGFCVSGHVETGMVTVGDKILVLPQNEIAVVKGMQTDDVSMTNAFAGDHITLILSGIDQQNVGIGDIMCNPQNPVPTTMCFQAHIVIFSIAVPITKGFPVVIHLHSLMQPAVITKLIALLHKSTGDILKKKPRCLPKNSSAIIEIATQTPLCLELYKDIKQLGRIMLRVEGTTIAAGLVTKLK